MKKYIIISQESNWTKGIKKIINYALFKYDSTYKIESYQKMDLSLQKEVIDLSTPKIYIIDVKEKNQNEYLNIAKNIRNKDNDSLLIFLIEDASLFEPIHKSIFNIYNVIETKKDFISQLINNIQCIFKQYFDRNCFSYRYKNTYFQIFLKSINYIYRDTIERKLIIVTDNRDFVLPMNLQDILSKLDHRFIQVHRACIINTENVSQINWSQGYFVLNNGEQIYQVSKKYKKRYDEERQLNYDNSFC